MASVSYEFPGDRIAVKQPALEKRRYCGRMRTCAHTGETQRCEAPLFEMVPGMQWKCRVCLAVETTSGLRHLPRNVRIPPHDESNHWCFDVLSDPDDHGSPGLWNAGLLSDEERRALEYAQRPRAVVEDVEPYWQCSNRAVLEEMGIVIDPTIKDNPRIHDAEQLGRLFDQVFGGRLRRVTNGTTEAMAFLRHEDTEWRNTIARLHERSTRWIGPINSWLEHGSAFTLRNKSGTSAWVAVDRDHPWGNATITLLHLPPMSHWATPPASSVMANAGVVAVSQDGLVDE